MEVSLVAADRIDADRARTTVRPWRRRRPGCWNSSPRRRNKGRADGADEAAQLLLEACRMGLHRHTADLLDRTRELVAEDGRSSRCAGDGADAGAARLARAAGSAPSGRHRRARRDRLRPRLLLAARLADDVGTGGNGHPGRPQFAAAGGASSGRLRRSAATCAITIILLANTIAGNAAIRGAACGLLFGDGQLELDDLVVRLRRPSGQPRRPGTRGTAFPRGLLHRPAVFSGNRPR